MDTDLVRTPKSPVPAISCLNSEVSRLFASFQDTIAGRTTLNTFITEAPARHTSAYAHFGFHATRPNCTFIYTLDSAVPVVPEVPPKICTYTRRQQCHKQLDSYSNSSPKMEPTLAVVSLVRSTRIRQCCSAGISSSSNSGGDASSRAIAMVAYIDGSPAVISFLISTKVFRGSRDFHPVTEDDHIRFVWAVDQAG